MCSMIYIYDKRENRKTPVSINKNLEDLPIHILMKYMEELLYIQKVDAANGIKINIRDRIIKLISSMPYFGGMSNEVEIMDEDKILKMTLRGSYGFEIKEEPKPYEYIGWIKSLFKKNSKPINKMATKRERIA